MHDEEKDTFIFNELQRLTAIFHTLPGIHDPREKLPRPEGHLLFPKKQFLQAFKYMAAYGWLPSEGLDLSLSAKEVKRRFMLETVGKKYDDSSWPKYAIDFYFNNLISGRYIGEFFPESMVNSMQRIDRDEVFEWEQQRFNGLEDSGSPCRIILESMDAVCLEILDFLANVEDSRRHGHDKYWIEVHKQLGLPPPPFSPPKGCVALIVIASLISTALLNC